MLDAAGTTLESSVPWTMKETRDVYCFPHSLVTSNKNPRFHVPQEADSMEAKHPHETNLTLLP